jgi:hypothetical protein
MRGESNVITKLRYKYNSLVSKHNTIQIQEILHRTLQCRDSFNVESTLKQSIAFKISFGISSASISENVSSCT